MKRMFLITVLLCLICLTEKASGELKYNPYELRWEYAPPDSQLKYNPYVKEWEFEEE
jgi:hypothetical protein